MPAIKREHSSELSDISSPRPSESTPPPGMDTTPRKGKKPKRANTTTSPTKTPKKIVKREEDGTDDDGTSTCTTPQRGSGGGGGGSGTVFGKARISADAKRTIANEIVLRGLASLDYDALERETGLSKSQIKSQLADNRRNLRHQLFDMIKAMQ